MRVDVLGGFGGASRDCRMTSLLINERIALDAGSLAQVLAVEQQERVHSILLTHSHMDHTSSLPFFIENVYGRSDGGIDIYASSATIYAIRKYLFNNATWPDFTRLPNHLLPAVRFHELREEVALELAGVRFTPIQVSHLVPTFGFLIEQDGKSMLWSSDTGPTLRLWEIANRTPNLQAVCIETSFDNALQQVADVSLHLTPRTLERELAKLEKKVPILLHHLKPPSVGRILGEIAALRNPDLAFLEQGKRYDF